MKDKVARFLRAHQIEHAGVLCAVSGGADSMALLTCLMCLASEFHLSISAVHFNHGLRGEAAEQDEAFVRTFCAAHQIPLLTGRGDVAAYAATSGESLEQAARTLRYQFFSQCPGDYLATAHTAGDNLETVLMHLIRGASLKGLCGIPPVRGRLIRPMLECTRDEVLAFLQQQNIGHMEDATNAQDNCLRNRLRHQVVPLLEQENPALAPRLAAACDRLRQEDALLDDLARRALDNAAVQNGWSVQTLRSQPAPIRARAALLLLRGAGLSTPAAVHVDALAALMDAASPSARIDLPELTAWREYDLLRLAPPQKMAAFLPTRLHVPGETPLAGSNLCVICSATPQPGAVAVSGFQLPLIARSRAPGDILRLPGGSKSLKKLMIDRKIPRHLRDSIPVITDSGGIVAVCGIGADRRCQPTADQTPLYIYTKEKGVP